MLFPVDGNSYLHLKFCVKRSLGPAACREAHSSWCPVELFVGMPVPCSPSASVLGSPAAVTPSWHPRPFPSGSHSTGLVPAVQPPHLHCRAGQVGTERCSGTEIKIYNSAFYRELPSPKWQENVAAPALHPA